MTPYPIAAPVNHIDEINHQLHTLALQVRRAFDQHDYGLGKQLITEHVLKLAPNHPIALIDWAFAEKALGNPKEAYRVAKLALHHAQEDDFPNIYDTLTSIACKLNHFEEGLYYARLAIAYKKRQANQQTVVKSLPKPKKLSQDKQRNIISFSLFGRQPRYCETAVINASLATVLYPEWTCRFYVDSSVPEHVLSRLTHYQAQIVMMDDNDNKLSGLFWRFLVVNDPNVDCFMVRDCDSLMSHKEQAAVQEWLDSGQFFHIMRDAIEHSELILAGMWGGYTGAFDDILEKIQIFQKESKITNKTVDQQFLRHYIYPTVAQSVLIHDSRQLEKGSLPFPDYTLSEIECIPYFHIGMVDAHHLQTRTVLNHPHQQVHWQLWDDNHHLICHYQAPTIQQDGQTILMLYLPYFYSENIRLNKWYITYQSAD